MIKQNGFEVLAEKRLRSWWRRLLKSLSQEARLTTLCHYDLMVYSSNHSSNKN